MRHIDVYRIQIISMPLILELGKNIKRDEHNN